MAVSQVKEQNLCSHYVQLLKLDLKIPHQGVVQATAIADFKMLPLQEAELEGFCDDWIVTMTEQFNTYIEDADQVKAEWPLLRSAVFDVYVKKCIWCLFPHFSIYLETFLILKYLSPFIFFFQLFNQIWKSDMGSS